MNISSDGGHEDSVLRSQSRAKMGQWSLRVREARVQMQPACPTVSGPTVRCWVDDLPPQPQLPPACLATSCFL